MSRRAAGQTAAAAASHHHQSHLLLGHRLQVRNAEGVRERGAAGEGLGRLDGGGEAVEPRPLAGAPDGRTGLRRTAAEVGRGGRAAQELVQMEANRQRRQALHVGAVDQLLATNHVRLQGNKHAVRKSTSCLQKPGTDQGVWADPSQFQNRLRGPDNKSITVNIIIDT